MATLISPISTKVELNSRTKKIAGSEEPKIIRGIINEEEAFKGHLSSIREYTKSNIITMPSMDLLPWNPVVIREIKSLLTREGKSKKEERKVSKERRAKPILV